MASVPDNRYGGQFPVAPALGLVEDLNLGDHVGGYGYI
jgi:hypothetical protein